jgi:hypothetical protein
MTPTIQIQVPISPAGTNLGDDVMHVVGRIVRWWSMIEFTVDSSIRDLLNRPDTRNLETALVQPLKQRFDLLSGLLAEIVGDPVEMAKLNSTINRLRSLQNYRDLVVHGMMITDAKRPDTHVYISAPAFASAQFWRPR